MHLTKTTWIAISGVIWFIVGMGLLTLGLNFIIHKAQVDVEETTSLIALLSPVAGGREKAAMAVMAIGLLLGFIKGRFVLIKTVRRLVKKILVLEAPIRFSEVYGPSYLLLVGSMISLGLGMKWLGIPMEIRGLIDVAVGSALINGASAYFRAALAIHKQLKASS